MFYTNKHLNKYVLFAWELTSQFTPPGKERQTDSKQATKTKTFARYFDLEKWLTVFYVKIRLRCKNLTTSTVKIFYLSVTKQWKDYNNNLFFFLMISF